MTRNNLLKTRDLLYGAIHEYQELGTMSDIEDAVRSCLTLMDDKYSPAAVWMQGWLLGDDKPEGMRYKEIAGWYLGFAAGLRLALGWL